jgi:hypothetical protein
MSVAFRASGLAGVAVAWLGRYHECLHSGVEAPPAGTTLGAVRAEPFAAAGHGVGGQRDGGRISQQRGTRSGSRSWSTSILPGASSYVDHDTPPVMVP